MANKLFAVFLMCMVVLAAVHIHKAEAEEQFKDCFTTCHQECFKNGNGNGNTFCEMKCDADCTSNQIQGIFKGLSP